MRTLNAVAGLKHFQIKGNGSPNDQHVCRVYKNGRHQIQVTVVVDAVDDQGQVVELGYDDMQKVELIRYDSGANLPAEFTRGAWRGYDYLPALQPANNSSVDADKSVIDLWFSVDSGSSIPTLQIGASIIFNINGTDVKYTTNNPDVTPGGKIDDNGHSNSSIIVETLTPYIFKAQNFSIIKTGVIGWGYDKPGGHPRDLDRWEITITDNRYNIRDSDIPDQKPIPWFTQWIGSGSSRDTCGWALPVRTPSTSKVYLGWNQSGSHDLDCWVQPYRTKGAAYAIVEFYPYFQEHAYNAIAIVYYDNYGCGHRIILRPNDNGTTLQIDDN